MRFDGGKSSMVCCSLSLAAGGDGVGVVVSGVVSVGSVELSEFGGAGRHRGQAFTR